MPSTDALTRLARDLSSSWNHSADEIGRRLNSELWELGWAIGDGQEHGVPHHSLALGPEICRVVWQQ